MLVASGRTSQILDGLELLNQAQPNSLVTQENFDTLTRGGNIREINRILSFLSNAQPSLLSQGNFNVLFDIDDELGNQEFILGVGTILPLPLTQAVFDAFIESFYAQKYHPNELYRKLTRTASNTIYQN